MTETNTIVRELETSASSIREEALAGFIEKIRGDIQEIMDFTGASSVLAGSHTLRLKKGADLRAIEQRLENMDLYDYKLSTMERKYYIAVELLQQQEYISMQQLADDLYVTRNTIVNDCKLAGAFLDEHGI